MPSPSKLKFGEYDIDDEASTSRVIAISAIIAWFCLVFTSLFTTYNFGWIVGLLTLLFQIFIWTVVGTAVNYIIIELKITFRNAARIGWRKN